MADEGGVIAVGEVAGRRMTAEIDGDFVVFLIGGQYEAVYGNMPPHGLGKAGRLVPVAESSSARSRLRALSV